MTVENDTIHTLEDDPFLQYIYIELVKVQVALTGEYPESLLNFSQDQGKDEIHEE